MESSSSNASSSGISSSCGDKFPRKITLKSHKCRRKSIAAKHSAISSGTTKSPSSDEGICSLHCLVQCLGNNGQIKPFSTKPISDDEEISLLSKPSTNILPFLRNSLFADVPPTILFYLKGAHVRKPSQKYLPQLTWCQNPLLPLVVRQSLHASHFKIIDESRPWIGYWGRHLKSIQYESLKPCQKVNHFPGEFHVGRKDRLWQHLHDMMKRFGNEHWCIMPFTYVLPKDAKKLHAYLSVPTLRHVILKPPASARGTGISIVCQFSEIPQKMPLIAQHYIENPLIINGSKFDLRIYVLVPSFDPLRVYVYDEGLVRFASVAYEPLAHSSYSNQFMHLTNYSINKAYSGGAYDGTSSLRTSSSRAVKWKLSDFWHYLESKGHNAEKLKVDIENIAVKALIACESNLREHALKYSKWPFISYELFGMDILVDDCLRVWLMEMNISPALLSPTPLDIAVKAPLARDVLNMAGIPFPIPETRDESFELSLYFRTRNCPQHKSPSHLEKEHWHLEYFAANNQVHPSILDDLTDTDLRILIDFEDELARRGRFKLVFPTGSGFFDYLSCFVSPLYSNLLLAQWQQHVALHFSSSIGTDCDDRSMAINRLQTMCLQGLHLAPPRLLSDFLLATDNNIDKGQS